MSYEGLLKRFPPVAESREAATAPGAFREHCGPYAPEDREGTNLRLDSHKATLDDFYARIRTQDWYHDLSEQEDEEERQQSVAK